MIILNKTKKINEDNIISSSVPTMSSSIPKILCSILLYIQLATLFIYLTEAHIVLTRDDRGGNLLLTEESKRSDGDNLIIANDGQNGPGDGGGQNSNFVLQDAANREGDVVINGKNLIIPGEDGHIVLADSRTNNNHYQHRHNPPFLYNPLSAFNNPAFALWWPHLASKARFSYGGLGYGAFF